jgi:hypothetical protein
LLFYSGKGRLCATTPLHRERLSVHWSRAARVGTRPKKTLDPDMLTPKYTHEDCSHSTKYCRARVGVRKAHNLLSAGWFHVFSPRESNKQGGFSNKLKQNASSPPCIMPSLVHKLGLEATFLSHQLSIPSCLCRLYSKDPCESRLQMENRIR